MNKSKLPTGWILYLALVVAAFFAHACAVEFDLQAEPANASTRQV